MRLWSEIHLIGPFEIIWGFTFRVSIYFDKEISNYLSNQSSIFRTNERFLS